MGSDKKYNSFKSFYPHYLSEHADSRNRMLHFIGTAILICCLIIGIITGNWRFFVAVPLVGYGFAWIGHLFVEKNKPATFTYPLYSLAGDFVMFWHTLTGQINPKLKDSVK